MHVKGYGELGGRARACTNQRYPKGAMSCMVPELKGLPEQGFLTARVRMS